MASFATACRLSASVAGRRVASQGAVRGFRTSAPCAAAQNFIMPALSPTMTEGNIATWKVKEGENFSAGDVLLEIETDKATMDVEAQDDGILMKIVSGDGSKAVQVGTRIGVIAEAGDDISSLELPADESPKPAQQSSSSSSAPAADNKSAPASSQNDGQSSSAPKKASSGSGQKHEQRYPLLPSVQHLVNHHKIDADTLASITPTGPGGRLLKGDVLAALGSINAETPSKITERFQHLSHLDLSNIKVANTKPQADKPAAGEGKQPGAAASADAAPAVPVEEDLEIAVPISLSKVVEVQDRIQQTLGVSLPLSTFISRATEVANDDLPPPTRQPTASDLFDQVLGLDKIKQAKTSQGFYMAQISALPQASFTAVPPPSARRQQKVDLIDELAAPKTKKTAAASSFPELLKGLSNEGANVFSLTVPKAEEERASLFLERMKVILEKEPSRLVL